MQLDVQGYKNAINAVDKNAVNSVWHSVCTVNACFVNAVELNANECNELKCIECFRMLRDVAE